MNNEYIKNFHEFYPYMKANTHSPAKEWTAENVNLYFERLTKILPNKESINKEQKKILKDMVETLKSLKKLLSPFENHGIDYELTIGGGAIRDLVLNKCKNIGDFDIILHFPNNNEKEMEALANLHGMSVIRTENDSKNNIKTVFDQKEVAKLLIKVLDDNEIQYEKFMDKNTIDKVYLTNYINAIVKIPESSIFKKPVDLILSHQPGHIYIENFDFEICKAFIQYKNEAPKYKKEYSYEVQYQGKTIVRYENMDLNNEQAYVNLLNHLIVKHSFVRDVEEKTLSLNLAKFEPEHVHYFLNHHYLKLQERYPEYKCNFFIDQFTYKALNKETLEIKIENLKFFQFHYHLEYTIPHKPEKTKTLKI